MLSLHRIIHHSASILHFGFHVIGSSGTFKPFGAIPSFCRFSEIGHLTSHVHVTILMMKTGSAMHHNLEFVLYGT
jgi:hypothetical protein